MQKLDQHNQFTIARENVAQILAAYEFAEFTFQPIGEGIANTSLIVTGRDKQYVLRIYIAGKSTEAIRFELRFQDMLRAHGIPVPFVHKNKDGDSVTTTVIDDKTWHAILMDKIVGKSVTPHPPPTLIAELATLQANMHLLGMQFANETRATTCWEDLHDSLAKKIMEIPAQSAEVTGFIERVKAYRYLLSSELPHGYNHLDIDFDGNVLTKDDSVVGIIDFDDLDYSPVVVCLGYTLWNFLHNDGEEIMRQYLREYEKVRPLEQVERQTLPHVIFFRNYVIGIVHLLLQHKDTPAAITNLLKLEKEIPHLRF